jgi:hypothetical protein
MLLSFCVDLSLQKVHEIFSSISRCFFFQKPVWKFAILFIDENHMIFVTFKHVYELNTQRKHLISNFHHSLHQLLMKYASINAFSLKIRERLRPKVTKILLILLKKKSCEAAHNMLVKETPNDAAYPVNPNTTHIDFLTVEFIFFPVFNKLL